MFGNRNSPPEKKKINASLLPQQVRSSTAPNTAPCFIDQVIVENNKVILFSGFIQREQLAVERKQV